MEHLRQELDKLLGQLPDEVEVRSQLEDLISLHPFNEFEFMISNLLARKILSLSDYLDLRERYIARNLFLYVFEISAPRTFGEVWAQGHLKELVPALTKPSRRIDPTAGHYDFVLDEKIKVEVKASRATESGVDAPLYVKALASDSEKPLLMNFQQIKPAYCDVFVWIAVWRDTIRYWVQSSEEVRTNRHYVDKQHKGNVGEGQLHVTDRNITSFDAFAVSSDKLAEGIRSAYKRQISQKN